MLLFQNYANDWYNQEIKSINYTLFEKEIVENFDIDKKIDEFCMMKYIECNSRYRRVV